LIKEPPLADSLWGIRLQTIWIFFTVFYSWLGAIVPKRVVSSWMILTAGILLLAVFAHVIVNSDVDRIRRTLLVVLAASLFVANIATNSFKDYVAAGFAVLFAFMLAAQLWRSRIDDSLKRLQYLCFVSMSLAVVGGLAGLLATLLLKRLILLGLVSREFYIFAPMETATMCGFSVGMLMGGRILSNRTVGYTTIPPLRRSTALWGAFVLSGASGLVLVFANEARAAHWIGRTTKAAIFASAYELCFISPMVFYLTNLHKKSGDAPLFSWRVFWTLVLVGFGASMPASSLLSWAARPPAVVHRWIGTEALTGIAIGLGVAAGFFCVNRLSNNVMAGRKEQSGRSFDANGNSTDSLQSPSPSRDAIAIR
jgi:hypothetical protein